MNSCKCSISYKNHRNKSISDIAEIDQDNFELIYQDGYQGNLYWCKECGQTWNEKFVWEKGQKNIVIEKDENLIVESPIPPYVIDILGNFIKLRNVPFEIRQNIQIKGIPLFEDENNALGIQYNEEPVEVTKNINLIEKLIILNELGFAFSRDYKQTFSPSFAMECLQQEFIIKKVFKGIGGFFKEDHCIIKLFQPRNI